MGIGIGLAGLTAVMVVVIAAGGIIARPERSGTIVAAASASGPASTETAASPWTASALEIASDPAASTPMSTTTSMLPAGSPKSSPPVAAIPPSTAVPAVVRGQSLPLPFSAGNATKVITVVAPTMSATTATLQAWSLAPGGGWLPYGAAVPAHLGSGGLTTQPSESKPATPIGSFTLSQAFGNAVNPGTTLNYFRTDSADWWVSDAASSLYNTHQRCSGSCSFNTAAGENLFQAGYVYKYAVVIDYNRSPVTAGAGSAFFLHVSNGSATVGCISIPEANLVALLQWLTPGSAPRILIGVA
jgi:L,D-peptidoglycan transpeptidase YkuD (ErfK/YbiS/YcfS/YnhG family)